MRVLVAGAGPAGLYFSYLFKKARPDCELRIVERIRMVGNQLEIAMTLTDPKNWEGDWKGVRRWNRVNDIDVQEVECRPDLNEHLQSTSSKVHVR